MNNERTFTEAEILCGKGYDAFFEGVFEAPAELTAEQRGYWMEGNDMARLDVQGEG